MKSVNFGVKKISKIFFSNESVCVGGEGDSFGATQAEKRSLSGAAQAETRKV